MKLLAYDVRMHNSPAKTEIYTIQEMSELTKEISKYQLGLGNKDHLTEELAHVILMAYALMYLYGINESDLQTEAEKAVCKMHKQSPLRPVYKKEETK